MPRGRAPVLLAGFRDDRRGVAAILAALCFAAVAASAAVAVDLGDIYLKSRRLQGLADLAALAAVQASTDADPAGGAQASAEATAALNAWPGGVATTTTPGTYVADASVPAAQRFTAGAASPNAVRVTLNAPVPLYFGAMVLGRGSVQVQRSAVAARTRYAAFTLGSGLVSLDGGVANAALSALTGSQVSLSLMDAQALASASVDLMSVLPALRTRAGLSAGSFAQTLAASVTPAQALAALSDALGQGGQASAARAAAALAQASGGLAPISLASLLDLGPYAAQDHALATGEATLSVGAMDFADAVLQTAQGGRQLSFDMGGAVPGLATLKVWLAIGQRPVGSPWLAVAQDGSVVIRTAQSRLYLQASAAPSAPLSALTGATSLALPVFVEAASAQAKLSSLSCPADPAAQGFQVLASPSLGQVAIAALDPAALADFTREPTLTAAPIVAGPMLQATAFADVQLGGGASGWQPVAFSRSDIASGVVRRVYAQNIAQTTTASLLSTAQVQVQTAGGLGAGVGAGPLAGALQTALAPAASALDGVLAQLEAFTGVRLGEADVRAVGLRCNGAALVG